MKYIKTSLFVLLLIQSIGLSAQSAISGRVIDKDSIPIAGVIVLLSNRADSASLRSATSDWDGRVEFLNLTPDNYNLYCFEWKIGRECID